MGWSFLARNYRTSKPRFDRCGPRLVLLKDGQVIRVIKTTSRWRLAQGRLWCDSRKEIFFSDPSKEAEPISSGIFPGTNPGPSPAGNPLRQRPEISHGQGNSALESDR